MNFDFDRFIDKLDKKNIYDLKKFAFGFRRTVDQYFLKSIVKILIINRNKYIYI